MGATLNRPPVRDELIDALAGDEVTQTEIAARYGCNQSSISRFARRHRRRIEARLAGSCPRCGRGSTPDGPAAA